MSVTLAVIRARVRVKIKEMDQRRGTTGIVEIDNAIADSYLLLASRIPSPRLVSLSAFTISANAQTFVLPSTAAIEYSGEVQIQLQSDKSFLKKITRDELQSYRSRDINNVGTTRPQMFSLYEDESQVVQGDCWPRSRDSELCDMFADISATDIRDAVAMDAASIKFARRGSTALVYHASAELVQSMTDSDLATRRLNRNVVGQWREDAERLIYEEEVRRHQAEDTGRTQRWVS